MDTSNRLNKVHLILGGATISLSSLSNEERVQLLRQVLSLCKALLPYMTPLETFEKLRSKSGGMRSRDPKLYLGLQLNPPLSQETQFFIVAILEKTDVGPTPPEQNVLRFLILTREGDLAEWEYRYVLKNYVFGDHNHETLINCSVKILSKEELLKKVTGPVLKEILASLARKTQEGVERKRRHLESMERFSRIIGGACDRTTA